MPSVKSAMKALCKMPVSPNRKATPPANGALASGSPNAASLPGLFGYTGLSLLSFAANSLLCRLALGGATIDAASFASLRLAAGALLLSLLNHAAPAPTEPIARGNWAAAAWLFLYAAAFSFAYRGLSTGVGALLLFGAVQFTMLLAALRNGERLRPQAWLGWLLAFAGLLWLTAPSLRTPQPWSALLMILAGVAWGKYSLWGKHSRAPLADTNANFVRATPFALAISLLNTPHWQLSAKGVCLALISGALTSGIGYVLWYRALRGLTATQAAIAQLSVPVWAALGGIVFLAEAASWRLVSAGLLLLGGVAVATLIPARLFSWAR